MIFAVKEWLFLPSPTLGKTAGLIEIQTIQPMIGPTQPGPRQGWPVGQAAETHRGAWLFRARRTRPRFRVVDL